MGSAVTENFLCYEYKIPTFNTIQREGAVFNCLPRRIKKTKTTQSSDMEVRGMGDRKGQSLNSNVQFECDSVKFSSNCITESVQCLDELDAFAWM